MSPTVKAAAYACSAVFNGVLFLWVAGSIRRDRRLGFRRLTLKWDVATAAYFASAAIFYAALALVWVVKR